MIVKINDLGIHADGCEISSHSELDIGELIDIPCPCHEYVWMLPDIGNQRARINCGGSYASGPELMDTDFSQCITVTDSTTSSLCQVAMVIILIYSSLTQFDGLYACKII